jgi:uncharacterized membrane protein
MKNKENMGKYVLLVVAVLFSGYASMYFDFGRHVLGKPEHVFSNPFWQFCFYTHIGFGIVATVIGPIQFIKRLRQERPQLHRKLGMVYVTAIMIAGTASFYPATLANGGIAGKIGFIAISICWISFTFLAFWHARNLNIVQHQIWMIRSYTVTFANVGLRFWLSLLSFGFHLSFNVSYVSAIWLALIVNLVVAEWIIWKTIRRQRFE